MAFRKNTIKNIATSILAVGLIVFGAFSALAQVTTPKINVSAYIVDGSNKEITNGKYDITFAFYTSADGGTSIWSETQQIQVENGNLDAYLGSVNPLPAGLNFSNGEYFLGIKIGTDSEMTPRKKVGAVPTSVNSQFLNGAQVGTQQGDILQLGANGKIDAGVLPIGTTSGSLVTLNKSGKIDVKLLPTGTGSGNIVLADDPRLHSQNTDTGTDSLVFNLGNGAGLGSNNFDLAVSNASSKPALRYNSSLKQWQYSNDGVAFTNMGAGAVSQGDIDRLQLAINTNSSDISNLKSQLANVKTNLLDNADGLSGTTASFSGLELRGTANNQLTMLQGCKDAQILKWDSATNGGQWYCADDIGGTGSGIINVKQSGGSIYNGINTIAFDAG